MNTFLQKNWKWLVPVAIVAVIWGVQTKAYNKGVQWLTLLAASLLAFYALGALLLAVFDLPILIVVAIILVLAWGAQGIYDYFTIATKPQAAQGAPTQLGTSTAGDTNIGGTDILDQPEFND